MSPARRAASSATATTSSGGAAPPSLCSSHNPGRLHRDRLHQRLSWTYGYDTENRLVSASKSGLSVIYGYDALGRRLSRKVTNGTVATTYAWLSVGDQEWAEFSGTPALSFAGATVYGAGLDEPVAGISPANARSYYFQDALGSVIALTNASGQLTEKHAYTGFGLETTVGANVAPYRYAGRRVDPETGLSYNRARSYSPALGRFLQADPAGTQGGLNLYAYAGNDPADITDPTGKWGEFKSQNRILMDNIRSDPWGTALGIAESIGLSGGIPMIWGGTPSTIPKVGTPARNLSILADDITEWLGPNASKFENGAGDMRFRSLDNGRQIRFDLNDFHGDVGGPHMNVETFQPRNLFPGDRAMRPIDNFHIYPK